MGKLEPSILVVPIHFRGRLVSEALLIEIEYRQDHFIRKFGNHWAARRWPVTIICGTVMSFSRIIGWTACKAGEHTFVEEILLKSFGSETGIGVAQLPNSDSYHTITWVSATILMLRAEGWGHSFWKVEGWVVLSPCPPNSDPMTELVDGGEINGQIPVGSGGARRTGEFTSKSLALAVGPKNGNVTGGGGKNPLQLMIISIVSGRSPWFISRYR
jgi:hypothetical protein